MDERPLTRREMLLFIVLHWGQLKGDGTTPVWLADCSEILWSRDVRTQVARRSCNQDVAAGAIRPAARLPVPVRSLLSLPAVAGPGATRCDQDDQNCPPNFEHLAMIPEKFAPNPHTRVLSILGQEATPAPFIRPLICPPGGVAVEDCRGAMCARRHRMGQNGARRWRR